MTQWGAARPGDDRPSPDVGPGAAGAADRPGTGPQTGRDWLGRDPDSPPPPGRDPVAVLAVACGFLGIVVLGLLLALVTAMLGATAGQRARESGRSYELPYLALALAAVDGVVWIVFHLAFQLPFAFA